MSIESVAVSHERDGFRQESHLSPETLEGRSDRHLIKDTLELLERPDLFLGEGAVGRVFSFSMREKRFCQKVSLVRSVAARTEENVPQKYRQDYREQAARRAERPWSTTPKMEAYLTNRAAAIEDDFVKVPTVYRTLHITGSEEGEGYAVNDSYDILLMEQVPGCNLEQMAFKGIPLPEGFDADVFSDKLLAFVKKMNEAGISHRDIAPRNVMIDFETGNPWLIDFGRGTNASQDPQVEEFTARDGRPAILRFDKTDEQCVEGVRAHLREYQAYRAILDSSKK